MSRKAWFGAVGFNVLGLALSVLALVLSGILSDWNWFIVGPVFVLAILFAWLTYPGNEKRGTEPKGTERVRPAFVRGDGSGSSFDRIEVDGADFMVDGPARNAIFKNVKFRTGRSKGWLWRWFRRWFGQDDW
jgi:hypothetical protein